MADLLSRRSDAHKAFLDMFADFTGMPIGLCELRDGQPVIIHSQQSLANFSPYCRRLQDIPETRALCEEDQCQRALAAFNANHIHPPHEELTLCHAGLYNQAIPIVVGGRTRAVLMYGEMRIDDPALKQRSEQRFAELTRRLHLDPREVEELRGLLQATKEYKKADLESLRRRLPRVEEWFFTLMDEEERVWRSVENVTHEIQTRLQAVVALAENLYMEVESLSAQEVRAQACAVLDSSLALDMVVQNLGEYYLEEYDFRPLSLAPLLYEAKRLFEPEASRRNIEIRIRLMASSQPIEISRRHMQYALNNLVHNAIKYSFRGAPGRERYVLILGRVLADHYELTVANYGIGILPEEIERGAIFQDGYQGRLTQGEYRTGSGKGLFFVRQVIERHHGDIQVSSKKMSDEATAEGQPHLTTFVIRLPFVQPKEEA